jgi:4-hydroxymandelate synthase
VHVIDTAYLELYVENLVEARHLFVDVFGFSPIAFGGAETGLDGYRSLALKQGELLLLVSEGDSSAHPIACYAALHGGFVRDVAFRVADLDEALAHTRALGGLVLSDLPERGGPGKGWRQATLAGPGDVVHTLVEHDDRELPPGYAPLSDEESSAGPSFTGLDHVALCLMPGTLDPSVDFYRRVFGFEQSHAEYVDTETGAMNSKVVRSANGRVCFPMQEPVVGRPAQIDDFLRRHRGPGVQHVALHTDDIVGSLRRMSELGMEFLQTPDTYYDSLRDRVGDIEESRADLEELSILADRDQWGYLLQIFTRTLHSRRTLFFEVIQRRNARGFGSANIRALFEAKEREREREQARQRFA